MKPRFRRGGSSAYPYVQMPVTELTTESRQLKTENHSKMPTVVIPPLMRKFTGGEENITLPGVTVRQVIDNLESRYPGIKERLCEEDRLKPGIAIYINGLLSRGSILERVDADAEIHFLPAIGGGVAEPSN